MLAKVSLNILVIGLDNHAELIYKVTTYAEVAQLVEQWTENPRVGGSIPSLGTIIYPSSLSLPLD